MRERVRPTRLELHRLKFNQDQGKGELLVFEQLSPAEKKLINDDILRDTRVQRIDFTGPLDEQIFDGVRMRVLSEWGVMCIHPKYSLEPSHHPGAMRCPVCGTLVAQWGWKRRSQIALSK